MKHNERRVEFVSEKIKELQETIAALQKILDNPDIGEKKIIDELGLDFPKYRRFVYDLNWANKQSPSTERSKTTNHCIDYKCLCAWQELLWLDVMGYKSADIVIAPTDTVETMDKLLLDIPQREASVLRMRYEEGLLLDECGERLNVGSARCAQLITRGIKFLRHRYGRLKLGDAKFGTVLGMQERLEADMALKIKIQILKMLDEKFQGISTLIKQAYEIEMEKEKLEKKKEKLLALRGRTKIEELDLCVRSYNALKRAGFNTLADFYGKTADDILRLRNIGEDSVHEITEKLSSVGIVLADDDDDDY